MAKKPWMVACLLFVGSVGTERSISVPIPESKPTLPALALEQTADAPLVEKPNKAPATREDDIHNLFAEGKFLEALAVLDAELLRLGQAPPDMGYHDWLDRQKWILKTALAWKFLEKQNCAGAMDILREIPTNKIPAVALKGFGYCKLMAREWADADSYLSQYIQTQTRDKEAVQMLARAKEYQGLYEEAIDLTAGLESMPDGVAAPIDLEPIKKSLLAKQDESTRQLLMETGFFKIHYQPNIGPEFIEKVVVTLEKTANKLNLEFGIDYPSNTIDIFFHGVERFGEITHGPDWASGIYDGQIRLPIGDDGSWSEEIERSIRHELAHALLAETVGRRNLPTWFQEGFAQMAECPNLCTNYIFAATNQKFMPMQKFNDSFMALGKREAQVAYKQSRYMMILLQRHQGIANIKQMFALIPGLDNLSSEDIIEQGAWTFPELHQYAKQAWESERSL